SWHFRRHHSEHRGAPVLLLEGVHTEASESALVGEVRVVELLELAPLLLRHDLTYHELHLFGRERGVIDALELSVYTEHRGDTDRNVQVRALELNEELEELVDLRHETRALGRRGSSSKARCLSEPSRCNGQGCQIRLSPCARKPLLRPPRARTSRARATACRSPVVKRFRLAASGWRSTPR